MAIETKDFTPAPPVALWHTFTADHALGLLESDPDQGITSQEVATRFERYGANELVEKVGGLQILDTCFGYLEWQCEKVATAVDSTNHSRD